MKDQELLQKTTIRFKFYKKNEFKYLSHLDIVGIINKAMRRAKIKIRYSQGYNPRPLLNFSPPTPLGIESGAEYGDIAVAGNMDADTFMRRVNRELMPQLKITGAKTLPEDAKKLMNDIAVILYVFKLNIPAGDDKKTGPALQELIDQIKSDPAVSSGIFKIDAVRDEGPGCIVFLKLFGYAKILKEEGNRIFKLNDFLSFFKGLLKSRGIIVENMVKEHCFVIRDDLLKTPMGVF